MTTEDSKILLRNLGFNEDFLEVFKPEKQSYFIRKEKIRKVASENAVRQISAEEEESRRWLEEEDKEVYQEFGGCQLYQDDWALNNYSEEIEDPKPEVTSLQVFQSCSQSQMANLDKLVREIHKESHMVKAYRSKLKSKFYQVYEENSQQFKENTKHKIFHRCNYPSCGRTFASAGWLKSHFQDHLKEIKKHKFNILFENFLSNYNFNLLK